MLFVISDGLISWENKKTTNNSTYYHQASSVSIETTGYALMSYIAGQVPFRNALDRSSIAKWMMKQRNSNGGFSSTQVSLPSRQMTSKRRFMNVILTL